MALFTNESIIVGHPLTPSQNGRADIRTTQTTDRAADAEVEPYVFSNIEVAGDQVT